MAIKLLKRILDRLPIITCQIRYISYRCIEYNYGIKSTWILSIREWRPQQE